MIRAICVAFKERRFFQVAEIAAGLVLVFLLGMATQQYRANADYVRNTDAQFARSTWALVKMYKEHVDEDLKDRH